LSRPALEVADIFRGHGPAWRNANAGHVSLDQLKVMSAIGSCRTAALGGHVARCQNEKCAYTQIAYNSCRNRHCPKCQGAAAKEWLAEREAELLPVPYFHVVFSLPAQIADIAYQNKAVIYDILARVHLPSILGKIYPIKLTNPCVCTCPSGGAARREAARHRREDLQGRQEGARHHVSSGWLRSRWRVVLGVPRLLHRRYGRDRGRHHAGGADLGHLCGPFTTRAERQRRKTSSPL
jgi:hypothetical protein